MLHPEQDFSGDVFYRRNFPRAEGEGDSSGWGVPHYQAGVGGVGAVGK